MKRLEALALVLVLMYGCSSCEKPDVLDFPDRKPPRQEAQTTDPTPQEEDHQVADEGRRPDPFIDTVSAPTAKWEEYIIPQGGHYNDLRSFSFFNGDTLRFRFVLDSSAYYQTSDPKNQADWNKLMGFSDCGNFHHTNSIRFVWRNYRSELQIGEYRYTNGKREFSTLGTVSPGDTNFAEIVATQSFYSLRLNKENFERKRSCNSRNSSYWLYPYFGGDEAAPREVHIKVQHLKPKP
jgi:hypothetical protein